MDGASPGDERHVGEERFASSNPTRSGCRSKFSAAGCCTPMVDEALSEDAATDLATGFKALGDPVRLRLLSLIAARLLDRAGPAWPRCRSCSTRRRGASHPVAECLATMSEAGLTEVAENGHGRSRFGGYTHHRVAR